MSKMRIEVQTKRLFETEKKRVERARVIALNRAGRSAVAKTVQELRKTFNIKASDLKDQIKIVKASNPGDKYRLSISHKAVGLIKYNARQTKKGVSATQKKGNRKSFPGAFITRVKGKQGLSNHVGVFKRIGKERLPIKELYGPSGMQMMSSKDAQQFIEKIFYEQFEKELARALVYGRG